MESEEEIVNAKEEFKNEKFFNEVNNNYGKRVGEIEHFSKHFFNLLTDLNAEFIHDCLNIAQHRVDMQKKYSSNFLTWYPSNLILNMMERNNQAWIQAVENTDSMYTNIFYNCKNLLRICNENYLQYMKYFGRNYENFCKEIR